MFIIYWNLSDMDDNMFIDTLQNMFSIGNPDVSNKKLVSFRNLENSTQDFQEWFPFNFDEDFKYIQYNTTFKYVKYKRYSDGIEQTLIIENQSVSSFLKEFQ